MLERARAQRARCVVSKAQLTNRDDPPACGRCKARMVELFTIAPTLHDPGLVAYECPRCGYVGSALQEPTRLKTDK